jgi:hypothetical protein
MPDNSKTIYTGQLEIDHKEGAIYFRDRYGTTILRVTHLKTPTPRGVGIDLVSVAQMTSYTPLEPRERQDKSGLAQWAERQSEQRQAESEPYIPSPADYAKAEHIVRYEGLTPPDPEQARQYKAHIASLARHPSTGIYDPSTNCPVCHKLHVDKDYFHAKDGSPLLAGHEYIITTRLTNERYERVWRMGLLGMGISGLQFDARGPGRRTSDQYGGTQVIQVDSILKAEEVERDDILRFTAQRAPSDKIRRSRPIDPDHDRGQY